MIVLSVGVKTASTPSLTSASAASMTSSTVVPVRSTTFTPFFSRYSLAALIGAVEESSLMLYSRPMQSASGSAAKMRFITALVSR